jgi:hypothetical protein
VPRRRRLLLKDDPETLDALASGVAITSKSISATDADFAAAGGLSTVSLSTTLVTRGEEANTFVLTPKPGAVFRDEVGGECRLPSGEPKLTITAPPAADFSRSRSIDPQFVLA